MEDGRAGVVDTFLVLVLVGFAAAFVHTLLRHGMIGVTSVRYGMFVKCLGPGKLVQNCAEAPNILEDAVRHSASAGRTRSLAGR
jgi:hypothetical protein